MALKLKNTSMVGLLVEHDILKEFSAFLPVSSGTFSGKATVEGDFVRIDVVTTSGETKSDVHMQVCPKKEVIDRPVKRDGIPLDVALIMFDSTSAANFRRKMPNTLEYLTKDLNSVLLQGEFVTFLLICFYSTFFRVFQLFFPVRVFCYSGCSRCLGALGTAG